jgi:hypothetical protein
MSEAARLALLSYVAANPGMGAALGGGLRKVRVAREGGGKSGGYRIIYVFGGTHMPIFLVTVFAKSERDNLSKAEQAAAIKLSRIPVDTYRDANERP